MKIHKANERYEAWLGERIPLIQADLKQKHALMKEAPFPFLRATFYRWAQTWPLVSPETFAAPVALAVGDLHVENFGTWRDIEGRLIWGINDFDEVWWLPYTCDLVRLATSALMASAMDHLHIDARRACQMILQGYKDSLRAGGKMIVLAEHHPSLREMAVERLKDPEGFWAKLNALPSSTREEPPERATKALRRMMPERGLKYRVVHRMAGLGSLGRRRYVALAQWRGGSIAREVKELTDSAWLFAHPSRKSGILYQEALDRSIRCPDPFVELRDRWIARRLAPDCSRIELYSLPAQHDAARLLHAMGWETANVHLGSREASVMTADLNKRKPTWLFKAATAMVSSVHADWEEWKRGA